MGDKDLKTKFINLKYAQRCKRKHKKMRKELVDMIKNQMKLRGEKYNIHKDKQTE